MKLFIRPEAEADLADAFDWYEDKKAGLGYEFLDEVASVLRQINENPQRYPAIYLVARRALVRRFPYKIFYLFEAERIEIIGVIHAKRDAAYWKQRVSN